MAHFDTNSQTWKHVRRWAEARIEELLGYLESRGTDWEQTIEYRAEMAGLRNLMGLPERIENGSEPTATNDD